MEPKSYQFIQNLNNNLNLPSGIQYGLIAEEIEQILPGLVKECTAPAIFDSVGNQIAADLTFKSINYTGIIPLLIASIKEQQNKIDSLIESDSLIQARIDNLEQLIINCCNGGTPASPRKVNPSMDIELSNSIILNQNDPNPFAEETRITFNIPENIVSAKIIFFDNSKHIIQTVKINERGEGQLNVYASNLTSGIYSYSLIADGIVVDTKKMVCTK